MCDGRYKQFRYLSRRAVEVPGAGRMCLRSVNTGHLQISLITRTPHPDLSKKLSQLKDHLRSTPSNVSIWNIHKYKGDTFQLQKIVIKLT